MALILQGLGASTDPPAPVVVGHRVLLGGVTALSEQAVLQVVLHGLVGATDPDVAVVPGPPRVRMQGVWAGTATSGAQVVIQGLTAQSSASPQVAFHGILGATLVAAPQVSFHGILATTEKGTGPEYFVLSGGVWVPLVWQRL